MPPTPDDPERLAAELTTLSERYLRLIDNDHPRGLDLLRQLRVALADLYAFISKLPGLGVFPSSTSPEPKRLSDRERGHLHGQLHSRLPPDLFWSALLPLTWETVGSRGTQLLCEALLEVGHGLAENTTQFLLELELPIIGRQILEILLILHEVVSDLDAYAKA